MKTRAIRLYGENDLRLETFELPEMKDDEILVKVISNSICMSTYKAAIQGKRHKRVPNNCDVKPVVTGHEFSGIILKVGSKWKNQFKKGDKFAIQPALNYKGSMDSPGYSFQWYGGNMTYAIIPQEVMEINCLIKYEGKAFFEASLAEPMSCNIGAFHAAYHTIPSKYEHVMGIKEGGNMAILGGCGPMGMGAIDYAIHRDVKPKKLVVTDVSDERLARAKELLTIKEASKNGVDLYYVNPNHYDDPVAYLRSLTNDSGFDDVMVYVPIKELVEQGDKILGKDGTLNFFAGPIDNQFSAPINLYNVHYASTKVIGSTGGNTDDMIESLQMTAKGLINPAVMVTHVGGLDAGAETILNLPKIPGGKKLLYTEVDMPLTPIDQFDRLASIDKKFLTLHEINKKHNFLWSYEAEKYLLENFVTEWDK
jgi:threonine dehydrogenase-like Zn-dependent dehydrogenase